jgi:acyl-CoA thioester hydrolase
MRFRGIPYREVESRGIGLPVTEATLRIRSGARYDDLIVVETRLQEVRSRRVVFAYQILLQGQNLAEGTTLHVPVDSATGKTVRLPPWLAELLGPAAGDRTS